MWQTCEEQKILNRSLEQLLICYHVKVVCNYLGWHAFLPGYLDIFKTKPFLPLIYLWFQMHCLFFHCSLVTVHYLQILLFYHSGYMYVLVPCWPVQVGVTSGLLVVCPYLCLSVSMSNWILVPCNLHVIVISSFSTVFIICLPVGFSYISSSIYNAKVPRLG